MKSIKAALHAFCLFSLGVATCFGQQPKPPEELPRATVADVKTTDEGNLVFAIRIYSSPSKPLNLAHQRAPVRRAPGVPKQEGEDDPLPFSLAGSRLLDVIGEKTYSPLQTLPRIPYFGPMEVLTGVAINAWIQMGVAFPPIPPPPPDKNGKKQPYQLLFEIPELKIKTPLKLDPDTLKPM